MDVAFALLAVVSPVFESVAHSASFTQTPIDLMLAATSAQSSTTALHRPPFKVQQLAVRCAHRLQIYVHTNIFWRNHTGSLILASNTGCGGSAKVPVTARRLSCSMHM